jgi:hypothetical protein
VRFELNQSLLSSATFRNVCSSVHSPPYATIACTGTIYLLRFSGTRYGKWAYEKETFGLRDTSVF